MSQFSKYSVALCSFNGENFIQEQLESIIYQTVPPDEIVISDDQSSDRTITIIKTIISQHSQIKWVLNINKINIGFVENFETAIKLCTNEVVFLSDQDDIWLETKAEIILQRFLKTNKKVIFTNGYIYHGNSETKLKTLFSWVNFGLKEQKLFKSNYGLNMFLTRHIATGATMAFQKSFVENILPIPRTKYFIHDSWISTIAICCDSLDYIDEPLIFYRQHENNAIGVNFSNSESTEINRSNIKDYLIADMTNKKNREFIVSSFFIKHNDLLTTKQLNFLLKRKRLYEIFLININKKKLFVLKINPMYYFYKMPNFYTLRMFIGNWKKAF